MVLESNTNSATFEPLKAQGHRVAQEVLQLVGSGRYSSYSLIGHSLGGIVGRLAATEIEAERPDLRPRVFVSLFSPHAGVQSFVAQDFLPSMIWLAGTDQGALKDLCEKDIEKSILVEMSRGPHRKAFTRFEKRVLYASHTDWLVDFETSAIIKGIPEEDMLGISQYPLLGLQNSNVTYGTIQCLDRSVRCEVLNAWRDVSFQRITAAWTLFRPDKHSFKSMSMEEHAELLRHLGGELGSWDFNLLRGARCASSEFCAFGLKCSNTFTCQPSTLSEKDCQADTEEAETRCYFAVETFNHAVETWFLLVTSSGGGGHLVAAMNLQHKLLEQLEGSYIMAAELLQRSKGDLTPEAMKLAEASLFQAQQKAAVELVDLMKSPCTSLDGYGYIPMGDFMTAQWNTKQQAGDIEGLKKLVSYQPISDWVFGHQCKNYMKSLVKFGSLGYRKPPEKLISTQPLFLKSLLDGAGHDVVFGVDLYMTDLPTPEVLTSFCLSIAN